MKHEVGQSSLSDWTGLHVATCIEITVRILLRGWLENTGML